MLARFALFQKSKLLRERGVREVVAAVNAMDYERLAEYMADDFVFADVGGAKIVGLEEFRREHKLYREAAGNPQVVVETLDHNGDEILVRGELTAGSLEVCGSTMWRVRFRGAKIVMVEVTRPHEQISMPAFVRRRMSRAG